MKPSHEPGWTMILEQFYLFVRRYFVAAYKQTILGPLWFLIQPLLTALKFTANSRLFGKVYFPRPAVPIFIMHFNCVASQG